MRISIYPNAKSDRDYRSAVGLGKEQFKALAEKFSACYQVPQYEFVENFGHERAIQSGAEGLFLVLFYLKNYPTLDVLAMSFGVSRSVVSGYVNQFQSILKTVLHQENVMP